MNLEKSSISDSIIIFASIIFVVLSFVGFYTITSVGSVIDQETGEFIRWTEKVNNAGFSVFCAMFPLVSTGTKKRWTRILAIVMEILNILYITVAYPLIIMSSSMIGSQKSASLTIVGWIGICVVILIAIILILKEYHHKKITND